MRRAKFRSLQFRSEISRGVAELADDEPDFFIGDFSGERLLDGLEVGEAEFCSRLADLLGVNWMDPVRAEGKFAFFDEVGDENYNGGDFAAAKLGDFLEGAALLEEVEGFLRGAGGAGVPFLAGASTLPEAVQGVEDFSAIGLAFGVAHAGDAAKLLERFRFASADIFERRIMKDEESGEHLFPGDIFAPLAEEFPELIVNGL